MEKVYVDYRLTLLDTYFETNTDLHILLYILYIITMTAKFVNLVAIS